MKQQEVFKKASGLRKEGRVGEALALLRDAVRGGLLDAEEVEKAGRVLVVEWKNSAADQIRGRILLLGQITTSWLVNSLTAVAWGRGMGLAVVDGEYDNIIQELMKAKDSALRFDLVVLLPWTQRLLHDTENRLPQQRLEEELAFWEQAWRLSTQLGARVLQVGYDWITAGPMGHHLGSQPSEEVGLIRRMNEAIRTRMPAGAFFLDLEQITGTVGRDRFYDPRRYFWTKQPFSELGVFRLAEHLWAGIRALLTGPKKVLVLDLDNTIWGGVVGETGPLGIALGETPDGEAFVAFQRHVKALSRRGVLLAACSKNNPEDARAPFAENPEMQLSLGDFAHFEASWEPKSIGLQRIAEALRLDLDSFVFFDDNPAERELIRQALPEVEVVDVPEDPSEFVRALQAGLWFESVLVSKADQERTLQYQQESQRRQIESSFETIADYQRSLEMQGEAHALEETDIQRVVQLLGKTNQFNLTTRRHSLEDVRRLLGLPCSIGLVLRLRDRFGDHGLVAVILAVPDEAKPARSLRIDTWLMSCRVISRTVEQYFFNVLLAKSRELGYERIVGEFIPTKKNALVANLYENLGFTPCVVKTDGPKRYELLVSQGKLAETFVR